MARQPEKIGTPHTEAHRPPADSKPQLQAETTDSPHAIEGDHKMTPQEFDSLTYSDLIEGPSGTLLLVLHTTPDGTGGNAAVGVVQAFTKDSAAQLTLVQKTQVETSLIAPDGKTRLGFLQTRTEPQVKG
jgi:hypothetical protein